MNEGTKKSWVWIAFTAAFISLAASFFLVPAASPHVVRPPVVSPQALAGIPGGTIRVSAGQLMRSGGDVSGLDCYACHHRETPPEVRYDAAGWVVLPREHGDLIFSMRNCDECHSPARPVKLEFAADGTTVIPEAHRGLSAMAHGRNPQNQNCYNCHERDALNSLHTAEGGHVKFEDATLLCAGCHGPTYRDWQAGVHGRTSGYWLRSAGPIRREECTSCHDPHAPAFTGIIPMPGPHLLHPIPTAAASGPPADRD